MSASNVYGVEKVMDRLPAFAECPDAIEVCVRRLQVNPVSPDLQIIAATSGPSVTAQIEGYYDELPPYPARQRVVEACTTRASCRSCPVVRLRG